MKKYFLVRSLDNSLAIVETADVQGDFQLGKATIATDHSVLVLCEYDESAAETIATLGAVIIIKERYIAFPIKKKSAAA